MRKPLWVAAVTGLILGLVAQAEANLIINGDFELGDVGFTSEYISGNVVEEGRYAIVSDPAQGSIFATSYGDRTTGSGLMFMANGAPEPNVVVWSQMLSVMPQATYDFSMWLSSWYPLSPAELEVRFNGEGVLIARAPSAAGIWEEFGTFWDSGDTSLLTISIVNLNTARSGNDFALDDISLVPEPATAGLLAVGILGMLIRRRHR